MNTVTVLLLAFFIAGTFNVVYITALEIYDEYSVRVKALRRLLHIKKNAWKIRASVTKSNFGFAKSVISKC